MRRVSTGYTILEVMIFLAISVALLGAAINIIKNKQSEVDFSQKMRDTQSKIQSLINDVSTGFIGADPTSQSCIVGANGRAYVQNVASSAIPNYQPSCTFLGKAIQFPPAGPTGTTLYTYSVFGLRLSNLPTDLYSSKPEPAVGQGGVDLTQKIDLYPAYVKSVNSSGVSTGYTNSHLIGFYGSINTEQSTATNGESDVNAYQYTFSGTPAAAGDQAGNVIVSCLEMFSPCTLNPYPDKLKSLMVCLTDGNRYAQLTISSNNGIGASVKLDYVNC